ncbi:nephrin [Procambarus clarkii]|uniref:nephrin n=1 Tax=Procambarus clarkii TaxID=6728 RepID=UPI00374414DB
MGLDGGLAALPCDVTHSPSDEIFLLLWFREPLTTPIYRLDERLQGLEEKHWSDEQQLGSRASLEVGPSRATLLVRSVTRADQGLYTCRVDYKTRPTKTTRVSLTVVVPPDSVSVVEGGQETPRGTSRTMVGPFLEGDTPSLTCVARGGSPRPKVAWYKDSQLYDGYMESSASVNTTEYDTNSEVNEGIPNEATTLESGLGTSTTLDPGSASAITLDLGRASATTLVPGFTSAITLDPGPNARGEELITAYGGEPYNTLTLGPLTREDLQMVLTCQAANNNITQPPSLDVEVDLNLPPLTVDIEPPEKAPLMAGQQYQICCQVVGARPPPVITWWTDHLQLLQAEVTTSADGNVTTSTLAFTPRPEDHGSTLRCVAETFAAPSVMEDTYNLTVEYVPVVSCDLGRSIRHSSIEEGDDVYFECSFVANPSVVQVSWRHNNRTLEHNVRGGVIVVGKNLVLQELQRAQAGRYTCHARNAVGEGVSNAIILDIKYAPVCSPGQITTYAVGRFEDAEVTCAVDANPIQTSFRWIFNNTADTIDVPPGRYTSTKSHSVITYMPMTSLDYGTLLCWATNAIGVQRKPCVFYIVPAGKPEAPSNCTVGRGTSTSVRVVCLAGGSGGLPQHFLLQARLHQEHQTLNFTANALPIFQVEGLKVGKTYHLTIMAVNSKGSSESVLLTVSSGQTNGSVYQLYDGPSEAEVRDGGKIGATETKDPEEGDNDDDDEKAVDDKALGSLALPSLLLVALGVGSGLVFLVILLLLFLTFRRRRAPQLLSLADTHHHKKMVDLHHDRSTRSSRTSSILTPEHDSACLEREMQQVDTESDADPDVIPQHQCRVGGGEVVGRGLVPPPPATLLPVDGYKYPSYVTSQSAGKYSGAEATNPSSSASGLAEDPPGCYTTRGYLHHNAAYLQDAPPASTLPPRASALPPPPATSGCHFVLGPQQLSCPEVEESSQLPPPTGYHNTDRKRVSFARHLSCEDDAPSTPLLKKGESCV